MDDIRSWLAGLNPEPLPPELRNARVRYRWVGEDGAATDLLLRDGRLRLAEQPGEPDVLLRSFSGSLPEFIDGSRNLLTAVMRGDVHIEGRVAEAVHLYTFGRHARGPEAKP